jgi:hypothetical protein
VNQRSSVFAWKCADYRPGRLLRIDKHAGAGRRLFKAQRETRV